MKITFLKIPAWLAISLSVAAAAIVVLSFHEVSQPPRYDGDSHAYEPFVEQFAAARKAFDDGARPSIDLASLNDGNWSTVCIFGGYSDPLRDIVALRAKVSATDRERLLQLEGGGRLAKVEEFEVMITYIDSENDAHFVHFRHGFGPDGQHFKRCITKPQITIELT